MYGLTSSFITPIKAIGNPIAHQGFVDAPSGIAPPFSRIGASSTISLEFGQSTHGLVFRALDMPLAQPRSTSCGGKQIAAIFLVTAIFAVLEAVAHVDFGDAEAIVAPPIFFSGTFRADRNVFQALMSAFLDIRDAFVTMRAFYVLFGQP